MAAASFTTWPRTRFCSGFRDRSGLESYIPAACVRGQSRRARYHPGDTDATCPQLPRVPALGTRAFGSSSGGECISYGARCLNEGGYHAIPRCGRSPRKARCHDPLPRRLPRTPAHHAPVPYLWAAAHGFLNAQKIKGSHTALKSGMVAAEATYELLTADPSKSVAVITVKLIPRKVRSKRQAIQN